MASARPVGSSGCLSIISVRGLVAELARRDIATGPLLRSIDLDEQMLADIQRKVPAEAVDRLLAQILELTRCPSLGLSVGGAAPEFQLMSHFAQALPTLREAIAMLKRYSPIFFSDMRIELAEEGGTALFSYSLGSELSPLSTRFVSEMFSAQCLRIAQRFFTDGLAPSVVTFSHTQPDYVERYHEVFGCPVRFSQEQCSIAFDADKLDARQPHANAFMVELLGDACERLLNAATHAETFAERLRATVRKQPDLCKIDAAVVAREVGLTARALRKQLADEGLTLTSVVEQARIEAAAAELRQPSVSIKEAAAKLGYSDVTAFHRAFKRWMGKTPGQYVREIRNAGS